MSDLPCGRCPAGSRLFSICPLSIAKELRFFIPSATSLGDFARTVYDRYAGAFGEKNISSRFEADEICYIFMVDKVKMESALSNLFSNALKFTAPGGSVVMSVKTGEETEEMVYADISVSDTGCGIAPEDLSFSASVLCSESRYGSEQIYRRIKQLTGLGIVEFIRDIRLRKAALYLSQGKFTVSEVMYRVGFTTASYFSKCFKEKYGVSPSEYKRKGTD